jgi:hypothetical protein
MTNQRTNFVSTRNRAVAGNAAASWGRNKNLVAFQAGQKLGPVAHTVLIVLLIAFLGLLYLTQLTKTSTFGYRMNDIDQKKTQLAAEQDDLKVENARLQSLSRVQNSSVAAAMTTATDTSYTE